MFPPNGQNPTNQVTGNEDESGFRDWVREELKTIVSEGQKTANPLDPTAPQQPQTPPPAPGITFADQNQLLGFIQQYNQQVALQQQQAQPVPQSNQVTGDDVPNFSVDQFVESISKDPRRGIVDTLKAAGYDLEETKKLKEQVQQLSVVLTAAQFKEQFPNFPTDPRAGQILDQVRQQYGLPWDLRGLGAAYAVAEQAGYFNQFRQQQPTQPQGPPTYNPDQRQFSYQPATYNPNQSVQAPPRVPRSSFEPADDISRIADEMSPAQIEQFFDRLGAR